MGMQHGIWTTICIAVASCAGGNTYASVNECFMFLTMWFHGCSAPSLGNAAH